MTILRAVAVVLALALMGGELWRSLGTDRPLLIIIDDQIIGSMLIAGAWAMNQDTVRRRALFASAWGFSAGQLYPSFFGKLLAPGQVDAGNWNMLILTVLVGVAFAISVVGTVASIAISPTYLPAGQHR